MILNIILILIGFVLLVKGADFLVDGSSQIARKFHVKELIIGLTIVSIGTSLPELIVSLTSSLSDHSDLAIGNIIGSNIANLFFILGACALVKPLVFKEQTVRIEIPFVIFVTALLYIFGNNGDTNVITFFEGSIFIVLCGLFIIYNIFIAKKYNDTDFKNIDSSFNNIKVNKSIFDIVLGIIALKIGGDLVVNNASELAILLGISEKIVSLTIVSISTSLPELITSVTATFKGEIDMAIGNIIGSNILNIVLIIGTTSLINPIIYSISYNKDLVIFMIGMLALAVNPFIGEKNKISRFSGFVYLACYFSYIASLAYNNI